MWMAGALGVAFGAGYYSLAVLAAVLAFIVLGFVQLLANGPESGASSSLLIIGNAEDEGNG